MGTVAERLEQVRRRLDAAVAAAGRPAGSAKLIAVSKTKPEADIREAYAAGQRDFGENYVQELVAKADALSDLPDLRWHFIGHLQRNKVKHVVPHVSVVHCVDSERLVDELAKRVHIERAPLPVLVEVNVGGETQKSGVSPEGLTQLLDHVEGCDILNLVGLMTVPPFTDDARHARKYFDSLAELRSQHGGTTRLPELSMGMTADLEEAIAAGATMVRVGTAIFGERERK